MKILSIDSCTEVISIALIVGKEITEKSFPSGKDFSENILPEITILLSESNLKIKDVDASAFGSGPVKGFAITLGIGILTTLFSAYFLARHLTSVVVLNKKEGQVNL